MAGEAPEGNHETDALSVAVTALLLGVFTQSVLRWTKVPYSVLLLLWGLAIGIGNDTYVKNWQHVSPGITFWQVIDPHLLTSLFLPPVLFAGAYALPRRILIRNASHIALLGGVAVLTGTAMTALAARYALPYGWTWPQALLFGAIAAATDPVAAVTLLKEVNAPEDMRVTVDGEALVDDGVAAVLFIVFQGYTEGLAQSAGGVFALLCRQSLGGPAVGLAFALCLLGWLRGVPAARQEPVLAAVLMLVAAYGCFFVSDEILATNGILAVVTLGMVCACFGPKPDAAWQGARTCSDKTLTEQIDTIWAAVEFVANTVIFVVCGMLIAGRMYRAHQPGGPWTLQARDYAFAVALWLLLLVIRCINIALLWPILARTGDGITLTSAVLTAWSGLRGIVGLALALYVLLDPGIGNAAYRSQAFFFMSTTLVLTVVVQGSLYGPLLMALGVGESSLRVDETGGLEGDGGRAQSGGRSLSHQPRRPEGEIVAEKCSGLVEMSGSRLNGVASRC
ncbi:g7827 [Coccomyxa elongata]